MADVKQGTAPPARRGGPPGARRADRYGKERSVVESIREATGASIDEIQYQLRECGGDVNKATEKLIDTPFTVVQSRKPRTKHVVRGGGRGRGREGGTGRGRAFEATGRGNSGYAAPRGRGAHYRNKAAGRGRPEKEAPVVNGEAENEKPKTTTPPAPPRKKYLEALCRKPREAPTVVEDTIKSGFLVQKPDLANSGWEAASSPPDTPVAAFRGAEVAEELVSEEEKSVPVDSVADLRNAQPTNEAAKPRSHPEAESHTPEATPQPSQAVEEFPIAMLDIRFTRPDSAPIKSVDLPMPLMMDSSFQQMPRLEGSVYEMASSAFLFGTFAGLRGSEPLPATQSEPQSLTHVTPEESPSVEATPAVTSETEKVERFEGRPLRVEEPEGDKRASISRPAAELLPASVETPQPQTSSSDFRLDVELPVDVTVPKPAEPSSFMSASDPVVKEESASVHSHLMNTDATRSDKTFVGAIPLTEKPQTRPSLEDTPSDFGKPYPESFGVSVERSKPEELSSFEETRTHRPTTNMPDTKPVLEPEAFGISSGPAPTLPSYPPQRHPSHKLPEKAVPPPPVGPGVTGHQQNAKYNAHPTGGVPPPGPNQGPAVNVPSSLNPGNSGNPSLPMMPQVPPFLSPGMMPNPGMPFPTGNPYYPQFMQYQHQMYHGLYAGTYGSFGAPFNHESVGHPAHASPVGKAQNQGQSGPRVFLGVPPNQGNQQFPVSFPNTLYTLGNTVYDTANPSSFTAPKEKDNVFLNQQQLSHAGFPGGPQPVPRNDGGLFYGVPNQAFSQGFRNQFHQPGGFAGQFPGGGYVAPPHTYHPPGQQGNNFRLH